MRRVSPALLAFAVSLWVLPAAAQPQNPGPNQPALDPRLEACIDISDDVDKSIEACTQLIDAQNEPASLRASALAGRGAAFAMKQDAIKAMKDFNAALELDPKRPDLFLQRGMLNTDEAEYGDAISDFNDALKIDPKFYLAYYQRGFAQLMLGQHDDSIASFGEAIKLAPKDTDMLQGRGIALMAKGDVDKAVQDFNQVLRLEPEKWPALFNRAQAMLIKKDFERALQNFNGVLKAQPKHELAQQCAGVARAALEAQKGNKAVPEIPQGCTGQ